MSDIVVGDVLAWEPELAWTGDERDLNRALTWAVTIHASIPVLPALRGGELIVLPPRRLEQLQSVEMIGWRDMAGLLAGEPVAGIVVEHDFPGAPVAGLPMLRAPAEFLPDAEIYLNRTITEHRAELYRLGADLSRALSTASISGADLSVLVTVAGDVGKQDLLLFDRSGTVLCRSRNAPKRVPFAVNGFSESSQELFSATVGAETWLTQPVRVSGGETLYLASGLKDGATPQNARLVLNQTGTAIEAFLGPLGRGRRAEAPPSREALLSDLLLGRVPVEQLDVHAGALGLDAREPVRVALFLGPQPGFDGPIRTALSRSVRERSALLSPVELAVLVAESDWDVTVPALQSAADLEGVTLTHSERPRQLNDIATATRQSRMLGNVRSASGPSAASVFDVLLSLWMPDIFEPGPDRLQRFAGELLGPLEEYDRERGSDLVHTLQGYLAAGGSATGAAERLKVHRNTLGYRLRRIAELTGADLDDADTRLALGLAFKVRDLQRLLTDTSD